MKTFPQTEQEHLERWTQEIREPARRRSEGPRRISVIDADAEYEIAPLPDGRWALRTRMRYQWGDCRTSAVPWMAFDTREKCVDVFVDRAMTHFGAVPAGTCATELQFIARGAMLARLKRGLFGFIEPVPVERPVPSPRCCRP